MVIVSDSGFNVRHGGDHSPDRDLDRVHVSDDFSSMPLEDVSGGLGDEGSETGVGGGEAEETEK